METFVLRWTKDNLPFWQGVDDGEKIEINAVAAVINDFTSTMQSLAKRNQAYANLEAENAALKMENDALVFRNADITTERRKLWRERHQYLLALRDIADTSPNWMQRVDPVGDSERRMRNIAQEALLTKETNDDVRKDTLRTTKRGV